MMSAFAFPAPATAVAQPATSTSFSTAPRAVAFHDWVGLASSKRLPTSRVLRSFVVPENASERLFDAACAPKRPGFGLEVVPTKAVRKESTMLSVGTKLIPFTLTDATSGAKVSVSAEELAAGRVAGQDAKGLLVIFLCNHCPFVVHIRDKLYEVCGEYQKKGIAVVFINSNSLETHPQDGPGPMKEEAARAGFTWPYLFDETQEVAKAYMAACTPDFYLFDGKGSLSYRGQFDGARPSTETPVTGESLKEAMDAVLAGRSIPEEQQRPSIGCNIKWTPGKEPAYF
eukprot:tig00020911_g15761.t1